MRSKYFWLCLLLFGSMASYAQTTQCGIYKTVDDYKNQQISIAGNCKYGKKAVRISNFSPRPYVYIKTGDGKNKFHQDSIYAAQDCAGNIYRIRHQKAYQLIEKGTINIYSSKYTGTVKKRTSRGYRHVNKEMTAYYFSVNDSSEIMPLTQTNVRLVLATDKELDKALSSTFPDSKSISANTGNAFVINLFLNQHQK